MPEIEMPGYRTVVTNAVFSRHKKTLDAPFGKVPIEAVSRIMRFEGPSVDDAVKLVVEGSKAVQGGFDTHLDFGRFQDNYIQRIAGGNEKVMDHVRRHFPGGDYETGRTYIEVMNSELPTSAMDYLSSTFGRNDSSVYHSVIDYVGRNRWWLNVGLTPEGKFPDSLELEYLMARGVRYSNVFDMWGFKDYTEVADYIRVMSKVFSNPENISLLEDKTKAMVSVAAQRTLNSLSTCLYKENAPASLEEGIAGIMISIEDRGLSGWNQSLN